MNFRMSNGDVRLYYSGTILPVGCPQSDSGVAALSIEDVRLDSPEGDYLTARIQGRVFYRRDGRNVIDRYVGTMADCLGDGFTRGHLPIGYILYNDRLRWITFRRQRTNRKGLGTDRMAMYQRGRPTPIQFSLDESVLCALYSTFPGRLSNDLAMADGFVEYKGVRIGTVQTHGNRYTFTLMNRFGYVSASLQAINDAFVVNVETDE